LPLLPLKEYQESEKVRTEESYEPAMAHTEQDAAQGNAGAAHPMAQRSPEALRLPGSTEEFIAIH
jgi:hypothetical protein